MDRLWKLFVKNSTWMQLIQRDPVDLFVWDLYLQGPDESPFAGGEFHFVLSVDPETMNDVTDVVCTTLFSTLRLVHKTRRHRLD
jgi:hypothetical protein